MNPRIDLEELFGVGQHDCVRIYAEGHGRPPEQSCIAGGVGSGQNQQVPRRFGEGFDPLDVTLFDET